MSDADATLPPEEREKRALMLWPTSVLKHATKYVVAFRGVVNADGDLVEPSAGFAALRDGTPSSDPLIEMRRDDYDTTIFPLLESAGVERGELQLAWVFTTSSLEDTTSRLTEAKDDAFSRLPETGVDYEIEQVENEPFPDTSRRITGRFAVPSYLTTANSSPDSRLVLDGDGRPVFQGFEWWPFQLIIPKSCGGIRGCRAAQMGHGLFGSYTQVSSGYSRVPAEQFGYITFMCDMVGMASADSATAALVLGSDLTNWGFLPDRSGAMVLLSHLVVLSVSLTWQASRVQCKGW